MTKNRFSAQRRRIHAFAKAWAKGYMGPGYHAHGAQRRALLMHVVTDYAANWLAEHGELPQGVHVCRAKRQLDWCKPPYPALTVDFTRLLAREPGYPEPLRAPNDPALQAEIKRKGEAYVRHVSSSPPK